MVGERGFEPPTPWSRTGSQEFFEFGEEREGEVFCFQRLAKAFIGADSRKLKMRRLPPTLVNSVASQDIRYVNTLLLCTYSISESFDLRF